MSLAGHEGHGAFARNTSWGGSSNTSWGGSSNTSWGGSSNTSWGGGRGRAAIAALALALPVLAALPFAGHSASGHAAHTAALAPTSAPVRLDGAPTPAMAVPLAFRAWLLALGSSRSRLPTTPDAAPSAASSPASPGSSSTRRSTASPS